MSPDANETAKERARLLAIIAKDRPERKPGARTRQWQLDRDRAVEALRRLDAGEPEDEVPW